PFNKAYKKYTSKEFNGDIRCLAHIINLVVQTILKDFLRSEDSLDTNYTSIDLKSLSSNYYYMSKASSNVIKYTSEIKGLFKEGVTKAINESALTSNYKREDIPLDTPIRWNSTFLMISIALELRNPLTFIFRLTENKEYKALFPTNREWGFIYDLKDISEILYNPSTRLQSKLYINHNKGPKSKYQQKIPITPVSENYYSSLIKAINLGIKKLESYYPPIIGSKELLKYRPYILGTILDPRLKTYHFKLNNKLHFCPSILEDIKDLLVKKYLNKQAEKGVISSPITLEPRPISFDFDNEIYTTDPRVEEEYNIYLQEALIAGTADPLLYWKNNSSRLPILAILARRVLAIPANSASIERAFSVSNNIITRRSDGIVVCHLGRSLK
ncbi:hypothetical protein GcM1_135003, partial [Golovinomyces cichoracearum]